MSSERYSDVWVCTDCYFAHHYGAHKEMHDVELDGDEIDRMTTSAELWYAGEDDEPVGGWHEIRVNHTLDHNLEPLGLIDDCFEVSDHTCSSHYDGQDVDSSNVDEIPCDQCGQAGWENGLVDFDWRSCDGCGSNLGGSRSRLSLWKTKEAKDGASA